MKVRIFHGEKLFFEGRNCPEVIGNRIALLPDSDRIRAFFYLRRQKPGFGKGVTEEVCINKGAAMELTIAELRAWLIEINKIPNYADRVLAMDMAVLPHG